MLCEVKDPNLRCLFILLCCYVTARVSSSFAEYKETEFEEIISKEFVFEGASTQTFFFDFVDVITSKDQHGQPAETLLSPLKRTQTVTPAEPQKSPIENPPAVIAIIIDDLGYQWNRGKQAALLQENITLAIIPFTPYAKKLSLFAQQHKREIMLHAPMETLSKRAWEPALEQSMSREQTEETLNAMIENLGTISGINNHGGSLLTQSDKHMGWIMDLLAEKNLYFVDSRTTAQSVANAAAQSASVNSFSRDVFLDNVQSKSSISAQLEKLCDIALVQGVAVGIGHPYQETLDSIQEFLPKLQKKNIELRRISQINQDKNRTTISLK